MPIYAYKCGACGFAKDQLQKISDPALTDCPQCGQACFSKQLSAPGFQLKGSGWYATDFKSNPVAPNANAAGSSASDTAVAADTAAPTSTESTASAGSACAPSCACH